MFVHRIFIFAPPIEILSSMVSISSFGTTWSIALQKSTNTTSYYRSKALKSSPGWERTLSSSILFTLRDQVASLNGVLARSLKSKGFLKKCTSRGQTKHHRNIALDNIVNLQPHNVIIHWQLASCIHTRWTWTWCPRENFHYLVRGDYHAYLLCTGTVCRITRLQALWPRLITRLHLCFLFRLKKFHLYSIFGSALIFSNASYHYGQMKSCMWSHEAAQESSNPESYLKIRN